MSTRLATTGAWQPCVDAQFGLAAAPQLHAIPVTAALPKAELSAAGLWSADMAATHTRLFSARSRYAGLRPRGAPPV
jgi:hypothetical protein